MRIASISTGFIEVPGQICLHIYAQGCKLNCKGCQNPELQKFDGGEHINVDEMGIILKDHMMPKWICWGGGDATYQPEDFKEFNKLFKSKGYKVALYTGQYFDDVIDLLENVDLVIDGPWEGTPVAEESTNQKVHIKEQNVWKQIKFSEVKGLLKKQGEIQNAS